MEARFWIWYGPGDGMVRLKLRPGQSLEWSSGGGEDEGWGWHGEVYEHEGLQVRVSAWSTSRDCDGRCEMATVHECALDELSAYHNKYNGFNMPAWVDVTSSQRDYAAEAAGY